MESKTTPMYHDKRKQVKEVPQHLVEMAREHGWVAAPDKEFAEQAIINAKEYEKSIDDAFPS